MRVAAIEHPVRAGQPWETPNKALDQELIGKTCGKSDEIYRICCKTYVCVCGMMTFEVLQAELRQCRAMLGRHPASLLPLVGGEGQKH